MVFKLDLKKKNTVAVCSDYTAVNIENTDSDYTDLKLQENIFRAKCWECKIIIKSVCNIVKMRHCNYTH